MTFFDKIFRCGIEPTDGEREKRKIFILNIWTVCSAILQIPYVLTDAIFDMYFNMGLNLAFFFYAAVCYALSCARKHSIARALVVAGYPVLLMLIAWRFGNLSQVLMIFVVMGLALPFFYDKMLHIVLGCAYVVAFAFLTWNAELSPFYYELPKDIIRVFASFNIFVAVVFGVVFVTVLNRENMRFEKKIGIQNQKLQAQNDEIEAQHGNLLRLNEKISKQNAELQESNQIIENKNYTILQSIRYAQRIQNAVLPSDEQAKLFLPEHFIFFRPCDIVSGDFYFFKKLPRQILLAAADCTGHGVPGAFMSMLGITLLNEITQKSHIYQANEVLDELRIQIKKSLRQVGKSGEQQDGLDIALCLISSENLEMSFSGAYNSCLIFRKKTSGKVEKTILEADRQPVGIYPRELPFSEHKFYLQHDDVFYLFSDGYQSQFGGEKNEKMKSKRFKGLLEQIFDLPVEEQKYILEKNFDEWKGDNAQTDDVVVIGVRIDNKFNQSKQYD